MADVKVPKLLHKMSATAQKAWYKKQGMKMPSAEEKGKSAAAAKKVVVEPRKEIKAEPKSVRAMNTARQKAYYAKGGRAPIGAGGSGGSNSMAGVGQSSAKEIIKGIKAGINPKVALVRYTNEAVVNKVKKVNKEKLKNYVRGLGTKAVIAGKVPFDQVHSPLRAGRKAMKEEDQLDEVTKAEAEKALGGPVKEKPKMPPGKQPAGYRYVRGLARKAMKAGLKKEEVEQVDEAGKGYSPGWMLKHPDGKDLAAKLKAKKELERKRQKSYGDPKAGISVKSEETESVEEAKKPDASMVMTDTLRKKMITDKDKQTLGKVASLMAAQKKSDKKNMKEESEMKYIEEKLTAADPASKWISDFVKSDNPKFAGKSKKERINQALGAYYAAKGGKNEQNEFLESKKMEKMEKEVEEKDDEEEDDEEEMDESAKDWKRAFSNVAQKNLKKDVGKMRSKVGRLNYIGMKPAVDATPKVTAAVTKKGSYSEEVEQVDEVTGYEGVKDRTDIIKRAAAMNRMGKQTFLNRVKTRAAEIKKEKAAKAVKKLAKEEVGGKTPETSTEVELAKKHGNPKKITYGDVIKARIASAKKKAMSKGE